MRQLRAEVVEGSDGRVERPRHPSHAKAGLQAYRLIQAAVRISDDPAPTDCRGRHAQSTFKVERSHMTRPSLGAKRVSVDGIYLPEDVSAVSRAPVGYAWGFSNARR
jgi:hypothetical protein